MVGRLAVFRVPEKYPQRTEEPGDEKGRMPAVMNRHPGYKKRGGNDSNIGSGVENARGQRAFALWKPLSRRLDGSREVARFSQAEKSTRNAEFGHGVGQRVAH